MALVDNMYMGRWNKEEKRKRSGKKRRSICWEFVFLAWISDGSVDGWMEWASSVYKGNWAGIGEEGRTKRDPCEQRTIFRDCETMQRVLLERQQETRRLRKW